MHSTDMEKLSDEEFHELVLYFIERKLVDGEPEDYFVSDHSINDDAAVEVDYLGNPACSSGWIILYQTRVDLLAPFFVVLFLPFRLLKSVDQRQ